MFLAGGGLVISNSQLVGSPGSKIKILQNNANCENPLCEAYGGGAGMFIFLHKMWQVCLSRLQLSLGAGWIFEMHPSSKSAAISRRSEQGCLWLQKAPHLQTLSFVPKTKRRARPDSSRAVRAAEQCKVLRKIFVFPKKYVTSLMLV